MTFLSAIFTSKCFIRRRLLHGTSMPITNATVPTRAVLLFTWRPWRCKCWCECWCTGTTVNDATRKWNTTSFSILWRWSITRLPAPEFTSNGLHVTTSETSATCPNFCWPTNQAIQTIDLWSMSHTGLLYSMSSYFGLDKEPTSQHQLSSDLSSKLLWLMVLLMEFTSTHDKWVTSLMYWILCSVKD